MPEASPTTSNDEIADLTSSVNSMLDRLAMSVDAQRQLLDDVRHELKTPITIVRGHLEMMDPADPHDVSETRDLGIAELDRLSRLVDDIDALAVVEAGTLTTEVIAVDALTCPVFTIFIIVVAAAEAAVGLGIVISLFRNRETVAIDEIDLLKF